MLEILNDGSLDAKQEMVHQVSLLGGLFPRERTADGIHEARLLVEAELPKAI